MVSNKFNFTNTRLRKLKPASNGKRSYYYDTDVKGLRLQITPAGTMSFQFQTWTPGGVKPQTLTLGKYPALSIVGARRSATEHMAAVKGGIDVESQRQKVRDEDTLDTVFEVWLEQFAKPHKKSWKEDERRYALYLKKQFGKKPVSWLTTDRVRKWHKDITSMLKQRGSGNITPSTANRVLALLSTIYNQAVPHIKNPCRGIKKFREESRDRFLQPDELKRFFDALYSDDSSQLLQDYVSISLFTGGRRSNILSMQWREISFERSLWTVPAGKSKNAQPMDIPLIEQAVEILHRRKLGTRSIFVFPGPGKTGHYSEPKRAWNSLLKRAGLVDVRLHDLRRTMGSWQIMTGATSTVVGKTLGHKSTEATSVYARLNLDPVRNSMEKAVEAMLKTQELPEKVVAISGKRP